MGMSFIKDVNEIKAFDSLLSILPLEFSGRAYDVENPLTMPSECIV